MSRYDDLSWVEEIRDLEEKVKRVDPPVAAEQINLIYVVGMHFMNLGWELGIEYGRSAKTREQEAAQQLATAVIKYFMQRTPERSPVNYIIRPTGYLEEPRPLGNGGESPTPRTKLE